MFACCPLIHPSFDCLSICIKLINVLTSECMKGESVNDDMTINWLGQSPQMIKYGQKLWIFSSIGNLRSNG